jgi:cyclase
VKVAYEKGLHELGNGLFAYLQPEGGWGWSNAGLITAEGTSLLVDTLYDLPAELRDLIDLAFGPFDFQGITVRPPSATFEGCLDVRIGDRALSFVELGPAHTGGDTIVHVPDAATVFTGDLLFIEGTPIVWASLRNWISACDRILELSATVLVPSHGPVTDASGVADVRRYLRYVQDAARERFEAGMDAAAAADDIDISDFAGWSDPERLAANVIAAYRELDPGIPAPTPPELFAAMARWRAAL